jgi:putative addiction module CopG family antidote
MYTQSIYKTLTLVKYSRYDTILSYYFIILFPMSTLSVPLTPDLEEFINDMVRSGRGANKADVVRRALRKMEEDAYIEKILKAQQEPSLKGNLRELSAQING